MAVSRKKQDDKNLEVLRELITLNGNRYCFDCHQRGPTYVNMTIGSFICSKCSGMLRGLTPPHRVKSISMATFSPEEIEQIRNEGNDYCRKIWLGLYEGVQPTLKDEQSVRDFMCEKYEKQRYFLDPLKNALRTTVPNTVTEKSATNNTSAWNNIVLKQPQHKAATKSKVPDPMTRTSGPTASSIDMFFDLEPPAFSQNSQNNVNNTNWPKFPVDFSSADIYNSSQANNNTLPAQSFANFENNSIYNSTSNDRYAALADLDTALREQNSQKNLDQTNVNPFNSSTGSVINDNMNKNPFFNSNINGNAQHYSNPFNVSSNVAQTGQSKNPFL